MRSKMTLKEIIKTVGYGFGLLLISCISIMLITGTVMIVRMAYVDWNKDYIQTNKEEIQLRLQDIEWHLSDLEKRVDDWPVEEIQ